MTANFYEIFNGLRAQKHDAAHFLIEGWADDRVTFGVDPSKVICGEVNSVQWREFCKEMHALPSKKLEGAWFVLLGYDAARAFEKYSPRDQIGQKLPDFWAGYFSEIHSFNRSETWEDSSSLNSLNSKSQPLGTYKAQGLKTQISVEEYSTWVQKTRDYIYAGDIFQANIAHTLVSPFVGDSLALYRDMTRLNPSPYGGYFCDKNRGFELVSNSPELLFDLKGDQLRAKPIAGTRRRGRNQQEDQEFKEELRQVVKEQAEHLMLVDLARNDLGRISEYGSVKVQKFGDIESYQNVHHLVSTVTGKHRGVELPEALSATFPGGTITGAPKIRSIEIINELESHRRNFYTGSMGIIRSNSDYEWNILIRTAQISQGQLSLSVGSGIVADSIPEAEYKETLNKAAAWQKQLGKEFKKSET